MARLRYQVLYHEDCSECAKPVSYWKLETDATARQSPIKRPRRFKRCAECAAKKHERAKALNSKSKRVVH